MLYRFLHLQLTLSTAGCLGFLSFFIRYSMDGPITLDKMGYTDFRHEIPTQVGKKIKVIMFNHQVESSNTFQEYTGKLQSATSEGVNFQRGNAGEPSLFYRFVSLGDVVIPSKVSDEFNIRFNRFYTYMWKDEEGGAETPISTLTPVKPPKGGKTKRKRKSRKSRKWR